MLLDITNEYFNMPIKANISLKKIKSLKQWNSQACDLQTTSKTLQGEKEGRNKPLPVQTTTHLHPGLPSHAHSWDSQCSHFLSVSFSSVIYK